MPLPCVTKETADSLAKIATDNPQHHLEVLQKLEVSNPVLYQYLDYTLGLVSKKFSKEMAAEVGSVVGMVIGLLESQAESDDMAEQFNFNESESSSDPDEET